MVWLDVNLPKVDRETREALSGRLTEALAKATGMGKEALGIRFLEYGPGEVARDGVLWAGKSPAPMAFLRLHTVKLARERKQAAVGLLTRAFAETVSGIEGNPDVYFNEYDYDNVGIEGGLVSGWMRAPAEQATARDGETRASVAAPKGLEQAAAR